MPHKPMSDDTTTEKQQYEARLQRRLKILKQQFEAGKIRIAEGLQVVESLKRVRYAPNGSIDLDTVDGLVRSMALAAEAMHDREEMKKSASLAEIQTTYFEFLEKNFGHFHRVMVDILHAAKFSVFENSWNFSVISVCIWLLKRVPRSRRQVSMLALKWANVS